jgi:glycosyltransferase involved in cell wall biosynthesis
VPSGENLAVDDEVRWLRGAGVDVDTFEVSNDDVVGASPAARARQAAESVWSLTAQRKFAAVLNRINPELVHVHNLFPLLTASVPRAARRRRIPVVWTVHNHRSVCVAGTHFRDGRPCHACRPGWRAPGVRHACYGDSRAASLLVTGATGLLRRTARRDLVAVAISDAVRQWVIDGAGLPPHRVRRKYNGVEPPGADETVALDGAAASRVFLFAGHLSPHKGVGLLLDAWRHAPLPDDVELRILGEGPLGRQVGEAAAHDRRITWQGHVDPAGVAKHLAAARAVVVPSTWTEPFGRTAAEALAYGRPVVTTGTGGLREIVDDESGWVTGTSVDAMARALMAAATDDRAVTRRSEAGVRRHRQLFSPEATTRELLGIYTDVVGGTTP